MGFSSKQLQFIQILCLIYTFCLTINLFFIIHNICRYIMLQKMNQALIIIFYGLLLMQNILRLVEFSFRTALPEQNFFPNENIVIQSADNSAIVMMVFVEITLILTMHRLYLALQLVNGVTSHKQVQRQMCIGSSLAIFYGCFFLVF